MGDMLQEFKSILIFFLISNVIFYIQITKRLPKNWLLFKINFVYL
jgi:hypothetical protein